MIQITASEQETDWFVFFWDGGYRLGESFICASAEDHPDKSFGFIYPIFHVRGPFYGSPPKPMPVAFIPCQENPVQGTELYRLAVEALTSPEI